MTERIDIALEPGVILFAIAAFVLINILIAAVLYPYLKSDSEPQNVDRAEAEGTQEASAEETSMISASEENALEERVDSFLDDIHEER